ncbi:MAG: aminopeptidase P family protein [Methanomassiliicoccales archaeon]|nr:MAG: aminopeptidase P family protein [Methanomassiliicoccales archaeon]
MDARAKRIFELVRDEVDVVIFTNEEEPNIDTMFTYVSGTTSGLFENCLAAAWPDGMVDIITNPLEETSARGSRARVTVFRDKDEKARTVKEMFGKVKRIGVNGKGLSYNHFMELRTWLPRARFIDVGPALVKAKLVKDKEEVERLREACSIVSKVAEEIPDLITSGMTEYEAAAEINYRMMRYGATAPSFTTIASFGANSAEPHHEPDKTRLRKNDTALFDYGGLVRRYGSDITRTFFVGRATSVQKRMYATVLEAQMAALAEIRPGMNGKDIDAVARRIIDSSEFKGLFIHSLGHSIGLSVHDGGRLGPNIDLILEEGMVLTVEPGIYLPGKFGVRIEDDIVVTKKGCEILTKAPKDMVVV